MQHWEYSFAYVVIVERLMCYIFILLMYKGILFAKPKICDEVHSLSGEVLNIEAVKAFFGGIFGICS